LSNESNSDQDSFYI
jgi:hypothetical protein